MWRSAFCNFSSSDLPLPRSCVLLFSTSLSLGPTFHLERVLVGFETQRHLVRDIADGAEGEFPFSPAMTSVALVCAYWNLLFFCSRRDTAHA